MLIHSKLIQQQVAQALAEDIGSGDLSAMLISAQTMATATVICRESARMCGQAWFNEVFNQLDRNIRISWLVREGENISADQQLCHLTGLARPLLSGERTALNFLQTLMGTATLTRSYVQELNAHGQTKLLDTRKTLPNMRLAQKYAVAIGGGVNHRIGLYDAILIKENHTIAAGSIVNAVQQARQQFPQHFIEVEVETLNELSIAMNLPINRVMLDNFNADMIHSAVKMVNGKIPLEVSGNVHFAQLQALGQSGVDFISTGSITKHVKAIDLSMRFHLEQDNA